MTLGFRTLREARDAATPENQEKVLTQRERSVVWARKQEVYAKYEKLHPGEVKDPSVPEQYKTFWHDWIEVCPAFRADRILKPGASSDQCRAMAIVTEKKGRSKMILCPACGYEGEYFRIESNYV